MREEVFKMSCENLQNTPKIFESPKIKDFDLICCMSHNSLRIKSYDRLKPTHHLRHGRDRPLL